MFDFILFDPKTHRLLFLFLFNFEVWVLFLKNLFPKILSGLI